MQKTKIEWCDYTINPIKGICPNNCWYCYARKMYKRFKWDPKIRLDMSVFEDIDKLVKSSKIFVGSTHEIFGNWIHHNWIKAIVEEIKKYKKHTFMFLTKFPERYKFFNFPENCWLGLTITGKESKTEIIEKYNDLETIFIFNKNNIKFISFEPLLKMPYCFYKHIDWIIIGGLSGHKYNRPDEAINEIVIWHTCENIPIFIKDNLKWEQKIQEFPKIREIK